MWYIVLEFILLCCIFLSYFYCIVLYICVLSRIVLFNFYCIVLYGIELRYLSYVIFFYKVVELVSERSVINGANPAVEFVVYQLLILL